MFKNKIVVKLSAYFAAALLLFAIILGSVFAVLFRDYTINMRKNELAARATDIAETLSGFMSMGGGGKGAFMRYICDFAGADAWIVDEQHNIITGGMGMMGRYSYSDLPENAEGIIDEVFNDKTVFSEDFSGVLSELTLSVGVPVKSDGEVVAVVLLHTAVQGINDAIKQGVGILAISIAAALIIAILLSIWLSKSFTDPIVSKEAQDAIRLEKTRRDFVANISHELRTPVTVLRGSLEALVDGVVSEQSQVEEYHRQMLSEAVYLQRLVGDLLDLSKLQSAEYVIERQPVSAFEVCTDAIRSMQSIANKKDVRLQSNLVRDIEIVGDYGRLRQLMLILLDNAVKFSQDGGVVEVAVDGCIRVRDYGCGIPADELPHIFDRFRKSRSEQNKAGTGLGMAIAKEIAARHSLAITAESTVGEGAAIIITPVKHS